MTQPDDQGEMPVWRLAAVEHDRRGVEWTLWRLGETDVGRVDANESPWFTGEYDRAADLWRAFAMR